MASGRRKTERAVLLVSPNTCRRYLFARLRIGSIQAGCRILQDVSLGSR